MNEDVPPQIEQVPQGVQGTQDAQVTPHGYRIPNVEGGIELPKKSNWEIRECLIAIA